MLYVCVLILLYVCVLILLYVCVLMLLPLPEEARRGMKYLQRQ